MLDPFPYNGGVTTGDCLWMGQPILTLAGDSYVSRQGVGLLAGVGLEEFVAANREDLIAKAAGLGGGTGAARGTGCGLRERFQASPQMDHAGYARELESALGDGHGLTVTGPFEIVSLGVLGSTRSFSIKTARTMAESSARPTWLMWLGIRPSSLWA